MRLLFLSNFYPPYDLGGMEQLCQEVALHLQERGHRVGIITSRSGVYTDTNGANGIIRSLRLQANIHHYRLIDFFLKRPVQEQANARELRKAIEMFEPNLIVIWGMWNLSHNLPYWAEQWMPGRVAYYIASTWPVDADIHEQYWHLPARHSWTELIMYPLRALAFFQLRRERYPPVLQFENAMCCSQFIRNTLVEAGILPVDAGVINNGVAPEPFWRELSTKTLPENKPLRLLYFGALLPQKGVHTAIEAMSLLKQRGLAERVKLTILGNGHPDYEASLRAMVKQFALGDRIHFADRVPRHEVPSWLGDFDVFLFTSTGPEAMARTVMEAMTAGLLVIGTTAGGQVEMLTHEENSLTFQAEDVAGLALCIERVIREPDLFFRLAEKGQQMVLKRFTLDRMVDEIENWFKSIVL